MNARDLLRGLKSKLEADSQIEESSTLVTPIDGDSETSKVVVITNVEGHQRLFEVSARLISELV